MKICLVCPHSLSFPGGVQEHVKALYRQLRQFGHEVKILAPYSRLGERPFSQDVIFLGHNRRISFNGSQIPITFGLNYSFKLQEIFRREKFDLVHLHNPWVPTLCWFVLIHASVPTVATLHTTSERVSLKEALLVEPLLKPIVLPLLARLSGRIAVSKAAQSWAQRYLHKKFVILPNGVDTKRFSPKAIPLARFKDGKINLLFVGRLEERKGIMFLLRAYLRLRSRESLRLLIVGDGPLKKEAKQLVSTHKLPNVCFLGRVSAKELPSCYATADIFCSPATHGESFGIVLLEAMASGLPIVASKIPGYQEVLTSKEGVLVPPKNPQKLAKALNSLIKNKPLRRRLGKAGLLKAKKYDWGVIARKILAFYQKILKEKKQNK